MRKLINFIAFTLFFLTGHVFSHEKFSDYEKAAIIKIEKDFLTILDILESSSSHYSSAATTPGSIAETLDSIAKLKERDIIYYSTSLPRKKIFENCLIGSVYASIGDYGNLLIEYEKCASKNCAKNSINKDLILVEVKHIKKMVTFCQSEFKSLSVRSSS